LGWAFFLLFGDLGWVWFGFCSPPRCGVCPSPVVCFDLFAGIRELLARFKRRPCAGRHLLFFAAAKKSRQKKAAHTANS
jgi:hypothetical protein